MSRSDQYIGLNKWARDLLESQPQNRVEIVGWRKTLDHTGKEVSAGPYDHAYSEPSYKVEDIAAVDGAWTEKFFTLHRYTLVDGTVYEEYIQAEPWSSGPMYFIALKTKGGMPVVESLWTEQEMTEY